MRKRCTALVVAAFIILLISKPSYARCEEVFLPITEEMQQPDNYTDRFDRDSSLFMIRGLMNPGTKIQDVDGAAWRIACDHLPPALVLPLRTTVGSFGTITQQAIRDVFETNYLNTIAQRKQDKWIKDTLLEFAAATKFSTWPSEVVPFSNVKRKTRVIYRSPEGFLPVMSVSQTLASNNGDLSAEILETEVTLKRFDSEDWDFYAYSKQGKLTNFSTFPSGERPAPRICIACHYDEETRAVNRMLVR